VPEHPTFAEAGLDLVRLVVRAEGTSGVDVFPGEMSPLATVAKGGRWLQRAPAVLQRQWAALVVMWGCWS